jgi:hypothetical protein
MYDEAVFAEQTLPADQHAAVHAAGVDLGDGRARPTRAVAPRCRGARKRGASVGGWNDDDLRLQPQHHAGGSERQHPAARRCGRHRLACITRQPIDLLVIYARAVRVRAWSTGQGGYRSHTLTERLRRSRSIFVVGYSRLMPLIRSYAAKGANNLSKGSLPAITPGLQPESAVAECVCRSR